jgi:hypothetical protein
MARSASTQVKPAKTVPEAEGPFPAIEAAVEKERRRGRGAQSNASGRYEAEARVAFDLGERGHRPKGDHPQ